jgi:hypothetical protein
LINSKGSFSVDDMIEERITSGYYLARSVSNILLDFKLKFVVVYMINEHTTDEEFLAKFY